MKAKYIHVVPRHTKAIDEFIHFINDAFPPEEHIFLAFGYMHEMDSEKYENVLDFDFSFEMYVKYLPYFISSKKIFIHCLFDEGLIAFFCHHIWLLRKSNILLWGCEIYDKRDGVSTEEIDKKRKTIFRFAKDVSVLTPEEMKLVRQYYPTKARGHLYSYYGAAPINHAKQPVPESVGNENKTINIQIGNSATETNCHIEALDLLSKFKDENIKIYMPLSYGGAQYVQYAKYVEAYARKIFGDKAVALRRFLPKEEYFKYMQSIDIMIFNNNRQQALGNIYAAAGMGKKIFLRNESTMRNYLKNMHLKFFTVQDIENMSYPEFIAYGSDSILQNKKAILHYKNKAKIKQLWEKLLRN